MSKIIVDYPNYTIYDDGRFYNNKFNRLIVGSKDKDGYIQITLSRKKYKLHRLVALYFIDNPNNYLEIDHINRIKHDNRKENLRWVNRSLNMQNTEVRIDSELRLKHIQKTKKGFYCIRIIRYKKLYCKNCKTKEDAIKQRDLMISMW
jgi:hypothetical protein